MIAKPNDMNLPFNGQRIANGQSSTTFNFTIYSVPKYYESNLEVDDGIGLVQFDLGNNQYINPHQYESRIPNRAFASCLCFSSFLRNLYVIGGSASNELNVLDTTQSYNIDNDGRDF